MAGGDPARIGDWAATLIADVSICGLCVVEAPVVVCEAIVSNSVSSTVSEDTFQTSGAMSVFLAAVGACSSSPCFGVAVASMLQSVKSVSRTLWEALSRRCTSALAIMCASLGQMLRMGEDVTAAAQAIARLAKVIAWHAVEERTIRRLLSLTPHAFTLSALVGMCTPSSTDADDESETTARLRTTPSHGSLSECPVWGLPWYIVAARLARGVQSLHRPTVLRPLGVVQSLVAACRSCPALSAELQTLAPVLHPLHRPSSVTRHRGRRCFSERAAAH